MVDYQSLYRRYRPQRFSEVRGQDHVVGALRHAVRDDRVAHAYLFSGPRGTGKTSTARILAKALNCTNPLEGEPCGVCDSCLHITRGASFDVHELDAASNNGVDAMRDLVARASLATPGRWKVYIVDEVHMLSRRLRTPCSRPSRSHPTTSCSCSPRPIRKRSSRRFEAAPSTTSSTSSTPTCSPHC